MAQMPDRIQVEVIATQHQIAIIKALIAILDTLGAGREERAALYGALADLQEGTRK